MKSPGTLLGSSQQALLNQLQPFSQTCTETPTYPRERSPQTREIRFVLRVAVSRATETKTAHKKKKNMDTGTFQVTRDIHFCSLKLPQGCDVGARDEGLRGPTLAQL